MTTRILDVLPAGVRLGVSPLSWANDVLEDLGADISLETCLNDAAAVGFQGVELGRKFPRDATALGPLLDRHALALASGWHSGLLAESTVDDEMQAVADHAQLLKALGTLVMVYGECAMMAPGSPLDAPLSDRVIMDDGRLIAKGAAHGQGHSLRRHRRRLHGQGFCDCAEFGFDHFRTARARQARNDRDDGRQGRGGEGCRFRFRSRPSAQA